MAVRCDCSKCIHLERDGKITYCNYRGQYAPARKYCKEYTYIIGEEKAEPVIPRPAQTPAEVHKHGSVKLSVMIHSDNSVYVKTRDKQLKNLIKAACFGKKKELDDKGYLKSSDLSIPDLIAVLTAYAKQKGIKT